jgi:putative ABC transport system permease protein
MRFPLWRRRQDRLLDEELHSHLELAIQDRIDRGESPERAAEAAQREFGNLLLVRETAREMWGWTTIEQFWQDLGYARRALLQAPAFTIAAVITLGLGIGANTAMFGVVRAVMLRPLPFPDPERLVAINEFDLRTPRRLSVSYPNFYDWQRDTNTVTSMAGYHQSSVTVTGPNSGPALHVAGAIVTANLFTTLGVDAAQGRTFRPEEDRPGSEAVVISDAFRRTQMGGVADAAGRTLHVNGRPYTIVGVMPPDFAFPMLTPPPQLWLTSAEDARVETPTDSPMTAQRGAHFIQVVGRLKDGVAVEAAQAEFDALMASLARAYPDDNAQRGARVTPQLEAIVGTAREPLLLLWVAVGFVLLMACVNLASLMTARGVSRQPELALRVALGASRSRVVRLLLAEAVALAGAAAVCGVGLAWWSLDLLVRLAPRDVRGLDAVRIDPMVLGYTAAVALACAGVVGLWPALRATRGELRQDLGATRSSTSTLGQRRWLNRLIVVETAVGVLLLVGATLVITGLDRLARTHPGFDVDGVATMRVTLPDGRYGYGRSIAFYDRLIPELAQLPDVDSAAIIGPLPLTGSRFGISFELPGDIAGQTPKRPSAGFAFISPGYFRTMRITMRQGREFSSADSDAAPRVVIVNDAFAREYFPGDHPIGKRIRPGLSTTEPDTPWREVIGVASDVSGPRINDQQGPAFYVPYAQGMITTPHIVVRAARGSDAMAETVRRVIARIDPELALFDVRTLQERMTLSMATERFTTFLLTVFAALGLLLTAVGLYGVVAYGVAQRFQEFGVRLALGARPQQILVVVMRGALSLVAIGVILGAIASAALASGMTSMLDFIRRPDATTYVVVAIVFVAVALLATLAPARRAMRVDPMQTLRTS